MRLFNKHSCICWVVTFSLFGPLIFGDESENWNCARIARIARDGWFGSLVNEKGFLVEIKEHDDFIIDLGKVWTRKLKGRVSKVVHTSRGDAKLIDFIVRPENKLEIYIAKRDGEGVLSDRVLRLIAMICYLERISEVEEIKRNVKLGILPEEDGVEKLLSVDYLVFSEVKHFEATVWKEFCGVNSVSWEKHGDWGGMGDCPETVLLWMATEHGKSRREEWAGVVRSWLE